MFNTSRAAFIGGMKAIAPILLGAVPFGLVVGVISAENQLTTLQMLTFSIYVFAGLSQLVVFQLYAEDAVLLPATGGRFEGRTEIQGNYEATFAQGAVAFSAEPRSFELDGDVAIEDGVVTVRDDGPGMSADVLARAGEPFFTSRPQDLEPWRSMGVVLPLASS